MEHTPGSEMTDAERHAEVVRHITEFEHHVYGETVVIIDTTSVPPPLETVES